MGLVVLETYKKANKQIRQCERFEPRSRFIGRLSMIIQVKIVLNRTVAVDSDWRFNNLCVIQLTLTLKMTTAQVVETSVTVNNNNSPIQDYTHPENHIQPK